MSALAPNVTRVLLGDGIPTDLPPMVADERSTAIEDLIQTNQLRPLNHGEDSYGPGPYFLHLSKNQLGMVLRFSLAEHGETPREDQQLSIGLALGPLRRAMRDYGQIVDSYYEAIRTGIAARIESIDMARRGVHNDAAVILMDRLAGKVHLDHATARRLFTLIYSLRYDGKGAMR